MAMALGAMKMAFSVFAMTKCATESSRRSVGIFRLGGRAQHHRRGHGDGLGGGSQVLRLVMSSNVRRTGVRTKSLAQGMNFKALRA